MTTADEQALTYRGTRPIAPSSEEMQALAGVGEASLLVIKELLHLCGCLSWEEIRGKQEPRPGRQLKAAAHALARLLSSPPYRSRHHNLTGTTGDTLCSTFRTRPGLSQGQRLVSI